MAAQEKIMQLNVRNSTMETDFTNPMVFDVNDMRRRQEAGEHLKTATVDEVKKWRCVYTTYFNKSLTIKEGRRVGVEKCIEDPNVYMLSICCELLKIPHELELLKKHPRDYWNAGRIKVQLEDDAGRPTNVKVGKSKRMLLQVIADQIPEAMKIYSAKLAKQKEEIAKFNEEMMAK